MFEADVFKYKRVALKPKFKKYLVNGTGRDSYINSSFKSVSPKKFRWNFDVKNIKPKNLKTEPKLVKYQPDNSG